MKQGKKQKQVQPTKKNEEALSYTVEVRDKNGKVLQRISAPSRSYVEQWNQIVNLQARDESEGEVTDWQGVLWTSCDHSAQSLRGNGPIGFGNLGVLVGRGSTAVAIDDYTLESFCEQGAGINEVEYQVCVFTAPAVVGTTCSFTIQRIAVNNSGATIIIRELGCLVRFVEGVAYKSGLGWRDVLPGDVTLPNGGAVTVTYTIAATV